MLISQRLRLLYVDVLKAILSENRNIMAALYNRQCRMFHVISSTRKPCIVFMDGITSTFLGSSILKYDYGH